MLVGNITNIYRFLDGTGLTLTDLKGANNGTLAGTNKPVWVANGYLDFQDAVAGDTNGNYNRVLLANDWHWNQGSTFSIAVIFRAAGASVVRCIVGNNYNYSLNLGTVSIELGATNNYCNFRIGDVNGNIKLAQKINAADSKWHIAVMTYDGSSETFACYFDGKLLANTTDDDMDGNFYNANEKTIIGCKWSAAQGSYRRNFKGQIPFLAVYSNVLSQAQVQDLQDEFNTII